MHKLQFLAILAAIVVMVGGIARQAFATTSQCQRIVTRTWDPVKGDWVYADGGCPQTTCDAGSGDTCYSGTIIGTNNWYCACALSAGNPCVATVHYGKAGPDGAFCDPEDCPSPQWCEPIWTPIHGDPQTLTCPCVL